MNPDPDGHTRVRDSTGSGTSPFSGAEQAFVDACVVAYRGRWIMRPMTTDMTRGDRRPYFLWDEDITIDEPHAVLRAGPEHERHRLLGKLLREARDVDVWHFVTPQEVADMLPSRLQRSTAAPICWQDSALRRMRSSRAAIRQRLGGLFQSS
jgi:hypothetical protein